LNDSTFSFVQLKNFNEQEGNVIVLDNSLQDLPVVTKGAYYLAAASAE
jgi:hypothetical protein